MSSSSLDEYLLPVSAAQHECWLAQQLNPHVPFYRTGEYIEIHGPVEVAVFEQAVRQVVGEADPLQVRLVDTDGVVHQLYAPLPEWAFPVFDLSDHTDPRAAAEDWMRSE